MHTIYRRLQRSFPFMGQRSATEDDFFEYCARSNVDVVFDSNVRSGIYAMFKFGSTREHAIFLNSRLSGWLLRYVMFHELGHFMFHAPRRTPRATIPAITAFGFDGCRRDHAEAEATAALLLLPLAELEHLPPPATAEMQRLIQTRLDVWRLYQI